MKFSYTSTEVLHMKKDFLPIKQIFQIYDRQDKS